MPGVRRAFDPSRCLSRRAAALVVIGALMAYPLALVYAGASERTTTITCTRAETGVSCRVEHRRLFLEERVDVAAAETSRMGRGFIDSPSEGPEIRHRSLELRTADELTSLYEGPLSRSEAEAVVGRLDAFFEDRAMRSVSVTPGRHRSWTPVSLVASLVSILAMVWACRRMVLAVVRSAWRKLAGLLPGSRDRAEAGPYRTHAPPGPLRSHVHRPRRAFLLPSLLLALLAPLFVVADRSGALSTFPCARKDGAAICTVEHRRLFAPTRQDLDGREVEQAYGARSRSSDDDVDEQGSFGLELIMERSFPVRIEDDVDERTVRAAAAGVQTFRLSSLVQEVLIVLHSPWRRAPAVVVALAMLLVAAAWQRRQTRIAIDERHDLVTIERFCWSMQREVRTVARSAVTGVVLDLAGGDRARLALELATGERLPLPDFQPAPGRVEEERERLELFFREPVAGARASRAPAALVVLALAALVGAFTPPGARPSGPSRFSRPPPDELRVMVRGWAEAQRDGVADLYVAAGERLSLAIGARKDTGHTEPYYASVLWSIEGRAHGDIGRRSGELSIAPDAPDGAVLEVRAEVGEERTDLRARVHVHRPEVRPLLGAWEQFARVACDGTWGVIDQRSWVFFQADGRFGIKFELGHGPFAISGRYEHDRAGSALTMVADPGDEVPASFQGRGQATVQHTAYTDGRPLDYLYLEGVSFGRDAVTSPPSVCKIVFMRREYERWGRP